MRSSGFIQITVDGHVFVNTDNSLDGYSGAVTGLIADYVASHGIDNEEVDRWSAEQDKLSKALFSEAQIDLKQITPDPDLHPRMPTATPEEGFAAS